ncbi:MAG: amino acid permease [Gammaproteobacteria bacterium]|jgi:basic amino acid/polyamine antiporter, APA family|nr:amino acid permease [Gammaproteobacteria bacterium]
MSDTRLERKISLSGAVFLLLGNIIGASIFILPGQLAGIAGPGVFIAYLIAGIPAIANCLIAAQIGSILPVSAAGYVFSSVVLHPFLGFLKEWTAALGLIVGVPILAYGFADYMAFFLPDADRLIIAISMILVLLVINLLGLHTSIRVQMILVSIFVLSLLVFAIGGLFFIDTSLLTPLVPNGFSSILDAAVPAFYSYSGFITLTAIAEEIKNPSKNIPLTLAITFFFVATIYTLITLVLPGLIPWQQLGTLIAPMSYASKLFLPDWFAILITVSALMAAATSANVSLIVMSRSFFALARHRIYPAWLATISDRTKEPIPALVLVSALIIFGISLQGEIVQYASATVIGLMFYGIVWAVGLIRLPTALPDHYQNANFKLAKPTIWVVAIIKISISIVFLYVGVMNNLKPATVYLSLVLLGAVYYFLRSHHLDRLGISLKAILRNEAHQNFD